MSTTYNTNEIRDDKIKDDFAVYHKTSQLIETAIGTQTTAVQPFESFIIDRIWQQLDIADEKPAIENLKARIKSAYQKVLSECKGVYRAFVKFTTPENPEYGRLDCDLYFQVSRSLYFRIEKLYEKTDAIIDYFEDQLDLNIFYHYAIYWGQDLEDEVREEAQEIYFESAEVSTASNFRTTLRNENPPTSSLLTPRLSPFSLLSDESLLKAYQLC